MFSNFKEDLKSILGIHQNPHFWRFFSSILFEKLVFPDPYLRE